MRILETWNISLISHRVENYDSPRASAWKKDKNLELKKMPTKHFENETFQIFRKIVDVDTCQESDISLKTSVAYRLVNSDPRGPDRTYYVSLLNIRKMKSISKFNFRSSNTEQSGTVRDGPWMAGWKAEPRFQRFELVQFGSFRHSRIKLFSLVRLSQVFFV